MQIEERQVLEEYFRRPYTIGIDGCQLMARRSGTKRYIVELCKELDSLLPNTRFNVYSPSTVKLPCDSPRWRCRTLGSPCRHAPVFWLKTLGSVLCGRDSLDAFWGGYTFLPILPKKIRKVVTVHDIAYRVVPGTLPRLHALSFALFFERDLRRADQVFSVSRGTAARLSSSMGISSQIINPAVRDFFRPASSGEVGTCLDQHEISAPYLLMVAAMVPRKNIETLLKSFILLKDQRRLADYQLVLVTRRQYRCRATLKLIRAAGARGVICLEQVSDGHLRALYTGAGLFVLPSVYEGFGIPLLEAKACGTRILAADTPETREAGGGDGMYVTPTVTGLAEGILCALKRPGPSRVQGPLLNWREGARRLARALTGGPQRR